MINIERPWMDPISMVDGNKVMASRGFKLIGIKLYSPNIPCQNDAKVPVWS